MPKCYNCSAQNIFANDKGQCPKCLEPIIYPCWRVRKGLCKGIINVPEMKRKHIKECPKCGFWECPECGAHGQPCNSDAPLSDWQKQQILNNQPLAPEQIKKNQEWWDREQERM